MTGLVCNASSIFAF